MENDQGAEKPTSSKKPHGEGCVCNHPFAQIFRAHADGIRKMSGDDGPVTIVVGGSGDSEE